MSNQGANTVSGSAETRHHYGEFYQRTADIEARVSHGLEFADRTKKEADFALRCAQVDSLPKVGEDNDEIRMLDFACGVGEHSRDFQLLLEEQYGVDAHIDARDFSPDLIEEARRRQELFQVSHSVRDRISFEMGDFMQVKHAVEEGAQYQLITIMGSSFMYLRDQQEHEKALKDLYDLLAPGGKLVIQFRERTTAHDSNQIEKWCRGLDVDVTDKAIAEWRQEERDLGNFAPEGTERVYWMQDTVKGDSFYFYNVPPEEHPAFKGLEPQYDASRKLTGFAMPGTADLVYDAIYDGEKLSHFTDRNGVEYTGFGRAYIDPQGTEHDMGPTYVVDYMSQKGAKVLQERIMPPLGYQNVQLHMEDLSPDRAVQQFALVAQKPV